MLCNIINIALNSFYSLHFFVLPSFGSRSFVPICSSKTSRQPSWSKSCHYSQTNYGERASTLPRTKPKTYSSPTLSARPSISICPAPKPNSSPTLSTLKPKPSDSLHLPTSQLSDPSPLLLQPQPKPSVSPTLTVPTPRLSPSPTSLCRGMSLDSRGGKQPSPVAQERRARSITISNTKVESSKQRSANEAKHDILDQEALLDFTHPALRRVCPMTSREPRHQTHSEAPRQAATSQNSCLLQSKDGLSKKENTAKDKPNLPPRNLDITAIPKPKSNLKQLQEFLPSGATGTQTSLSESEGIKCANVVQRDSQLVFDGRATQSSLHRKCVDYSQSRNYAQTAGFTSSDQSYERVYSERSAALPVIPKMSFSTEPLLNQSTVSPNTGTRRRRFGFNNETKVDATFLSGSNFRKPQEENNIRTITGGASKLFQQTVSENIKSPQKHRFWSRVQSQTTQMDVRSVVSQSDCVSKDYSCQSKDIDRKMEAPQCTHRLHRLKTCPVAPHAQEASVECTTSKTTFSKPDIISHKQQLDQEQRPGRNKSHKEVNLSDTGLNQTASDCHGVPTKLPEYPSEKCVVSWPPSVALCPFNTNSSGISSKGVFDLPSQPQHRVYQRPDETTTTTASLTLQQPNYSPADRAFIMEEPEDPYYVTMYYPGSVYVGEYRDIQTT